MLAVIQMSNPCTFVQDPSMTKSDCGLHWSSLVNSLMCTHISILIWFLQRLNPKSLEAVPWFTIKSPRNKKNLCFDLYTQKPDLIEKENLSREIFLSRLEKKSMFYRITLICLQTSENVIKIIYFLQSELLAYLISILRNVTKINKKYFLPFDYRGNKSQTNWTYNFVHLNI